MMLFGFVWSERYPILYFFFSVQEAGIIVSTTFSSIDEVTINDMYGHDTLPNSSRSKDFHQLSTTHVAGCQQRMYIYVVYMPQCRQLGSVDVLLSNHHAIKLR